MHKWEYTLEDIPNHRITETIRNAYHESPWQKVKKFIYKGDKCVVKDIVFVYDGGGYVLKLNYTVNGEPRYKYIKNINSLKYLKILSIKAVDILA
jgi:hypothetical protein